MRWKFTLEESQHGSCGKKKENICARNGGAGKRGAATVAGEAWPEAREYGGSITLVEKEEGLVWWWRVAGTVVERDSVQSKRRLVGAAWPEARCDGGSTTMVEEQGGSCGGFAGTAAERDGGDAARARKKKRRSRFCALIKLYGLDSIDYRGI